MPGAAASRARQTSGALLLQRCKEERGAVAVDPARGLCCAGAGEEADDDVRCGLPLDRGEQQLRPVLGPGARVSVQQCGQHRRRRVGDVAADDREEGQAAPLRGPLEDDLGVRGAAA